MKRGLISLVAALAACGPSKSTTDTDTDSSTGDASTSTDPSTDPSTTPSTDPSTDPSTTPTTDPSTTEDPTATAPTTGPDPLTEGTGDMPTECGDELPPAGEPCLNEGENCSPNESDCDPFVAAICTDGVWEHIEVGPGDPEECMACDPFPVEGEPCRNSGASCSSGCEDQCQFCNILACEEGTWQGVEVFPAPCLGCEEICGPTVAPMCDNGPPDVDACVAGCQETMQGECNIRFSDARACAGFEPTFTCDASERPTVAGCEEQFEALYTCLGI